MLFKSFVKSISLLLVISDGVVAHEAFTIDLETSLEPE